MHGHTNNKQKVYVYLQQKPLFQVSYIYELSESLST